MRRLTLTLLLACIALAGLAGPVLAQAGPSTKPDLWGHLPGALVVGIPLAIGLALYVSYLLGREPEEQTRPRREGAVSRAIERQKQGEKR